MKQYITILLLRSTTSHSTRVHPTLISFNSRCRCTSDKYRVPIWCLAMHRSPDRIRITTNIRTRALIPANTVLLINSALYCKGKSSFDACHAPALTFQLGK